MRGFEVVSVVIAVFFMIGISVGVLLIVALPVISRYLSERKRLRRNRRRYLNGYDWPEPPPRDDERPPSWPGG